MTWVKLDDGFADHPKVAGLSDAAFRLHVSALCYCGRHLTDGVLPRAIVWRLSTTEAPQDAADELVAANLWTADDGGFVVRDFLDFNPSKQKVLEDRERRSSAGKKGADSRWHGTSHSTSHGESHDDRTATALTMSMHPTRPDPSKETRSLGSSSEPVDNETIVEAVAASDPAVQSVLGEARKKTRSSTVTPMFKKKDPA